MNFPAWTVARGSAAWDPATLSVSFACERKMVGEVWSCDPIVYQHYLLRPMGILHAITALRNAATEFHAALMATGPRPRGSHGHFPGQGFSFLSASCKLQLFLLSNEELTS